MGLRCGHRRSEPQKSGSLRNCTSSVLVLFLAGFIPYLLFGGSIRKHHSYDTCRKVQDAGLESGSIGGRALGDLLPQPFRHGGRVGLRRNLGISLAGELPAAVFIGSILRYRALVFFDGGTRSWVALAVLPTFLAWFATTMNRHMTLGRIVVFVLILCGLQLSFEIARASRNKGWAVDRVKTIDTSKRHFDNDFFTDLAVSVDLVPKRHPYFHFGDMWAFVTHPVPRFLWSDKPISPLLLYYNDAVHTGLLGKRGNKLPSHLGQFHMSFGLFGVVAMGLLSGLIAAFASTMMSSKFVGLSHFGGLLATWWFLMARGLYPGWIYVVLFAWLILLFGFRSCAVRFAILSPASA